MERHYILLMYSIESLPEKVSHGLRLTPRSTEAMRRMGLKTDDIVSKDIDEVQKTFGDGETDKALLEKRWEHFELKRMARIAQLKELRTEIVE